MDLSEKIRLRFCSSSSGSSSGETDFGHSGEDKDLLARVIIMEGNNLSTEILSRM